MKAKISGSVYKGYTLLLKRDKPGFKVVGIKGEEFVYGPQRPYPAEALFYAALTIDGVIDGTNQTYEDRTA